MNKSVHMGLRHFDVTNVKNEQVTGVCYKSTEITVYTSFGMQLLDSSGILSDIQGVHEIILTPILFLILRIERK